MIRLFIICLSETVKNVIFVCCGLHFYAVASISKMLRSYFYHQYAEDCSFKQNKARHGD